MDNSENTGKTYQYGFSLKGGEVVEEWLYSKAKTARNTYRTIFYRKKGEALEMNSFAKNYVENITAALNPESLIVSLGAKLRIAKLKKSGTGFWGMKLLTLETRRKIVSVPGCSQKVLSVAKMCGAM